MLSRVSPASWTATKTATLAKLTRRRCGVFVERSISAPAGLLVSCILSFGRLIESCARRKPSASAKKCQRLCALVRWPPTFIRAAHELGKWMCGPQASGAAWQYLMTRFRWRKRTIQTKMRSICRSLSRHLLQSPLQLQCLLQPPLWTNPLRPVPLSNPSLPPSAEASR